MHHLEFAQVYDYRASTGSIVVPITLRYGPNKNRFHRQR